MARSGWARLPVDSQCRALVVEGMIQPQHAAPVQHYSASGPTDRGVVFKNSAPKTRPPHGGSRTVRARAPEIPRNAI